MVLIYCSHSRYRNQRSEMILRNFLTRTFRITVAKCFWIKSDNDHVISGRNYFKEVAESFIESYAHKVHNPMKYFNFDEFSGEQ